MQLCLVIIMVVVQHLLYIYCAGLMCWCCMLNVCVSVCVWWAWQKQAELIQMSFVGELMWSQWTMFWFLKCFGTAVMHLCSFCCRQTRKCYMMMNYDWWWWERCSLVPLGAYDWIIYVCRWCGLIADYLYYLFRDIISVLYGRQWCRMWWIWSHSVFSHLHPFMLPAHHTWCRYALHFWFRYTCHLMHVRLSHDAANLSHLMAATLFTSNINTMAVCVSHLT